MFGVDLYTLLDMLLSLFTMEIKIIAYCKLPSAQ